MFIFIHYLVSFINSNWNFFTGDSQEECMGCGKTYLAFSTPLNGKNFCRSCSNDASTPNQTTFPTEKFSSYTDSGSDESYVTENEDNEEAHSEK